MASSSPILATLNRTAAWLPATVVVLAVVGVAWVLMGRPALEGSETASVARPDWQAPSSIPVDAWAVFKADQGSVDPVQGVAQRVRLVGTYLQGADGDVRGKALLEFVEEGRQRMVEQDEIILGVYRVQDIGESSVLIAGPEGDVTLWRKGLVPEPAKVVSKAADKSAITFEDAPALETSRFGKRIAENQWVFKREQLLQYHEELMSDPRRLSELLLSFGEHQHENEVNGYQVDVKGESEFFENLGLQPGDVINRVNHMRMVNHGRARFFLREFMGDRVPMFILDVERDGKPIKQMYMIR